MNTQHTHDTWIGKATSSDQGLIYSEQTGRNIAVCYDTKHTALIAMAPAMLQALQRITHPAADDDDLEHALSVIAQATGVQP